MQADELARFIDKRLGEIFGEPFRIDGTELRISARVGIALFPGDGDNPDALFRNAEAALKKAKATGERYMFYEQAMNAFMYDARPDGSSALPRIRGWHRGFSKYSLAFLDGSAIHTYIDTKRTIDPDGARWTSWPEPRTVTDSNGHEYWPGFGS